MTPRRVASALAGIAATYLTLVAVAAGVAVIRAERRLQKRGL